MIRPTLLALPLVLLAAGAQARDAGCRIEQAGRVVFDRTCDFAPDGRDGSFTLSPRGGGQSVSVIEPGLAEVRGLTRDGINSRWGAARRSQRDGACWQGEDFRICAR